jgi:hypothetical protein
MSASYPEFKTPSDYIVPEGLNEGEIFEDICTLKLKSNGQLCIVKIGDSAIKEEGKAAKSEPEDLGTEEGITSRLTEAYRNRAA